jgi:hypothetical protein
MAALLMAAFKIAITPFLTSVGSGLGSHVAEWVWSTLTGAGHHEIAANMKAGTASLDVQKTAQQVVASAVTDPVKASELYQVAATNPIAQPLAQTYTALLSVQPQAWNEFASGSSTLQGLSESRAQLFGWSKDQLTYDTTSHCPIGGEPLNPLGGVTYIDNTGKTLFSAWMPRQPPFWNPVDRQFHDYAITAHCVNGHPWQVYAS